MELAIIQACFEYRDKTRAEAHEESKVEIIDIDSEYDKNEQDRPIHSEIKNDKQPLNVITNFNIDQDVDDKLAPTRLQ